MSKRLLESLNGRNRGLLHQWLNDLKGEPRVAWYPSAGEDFRDLLYLHPRFLDANPATKTDPREPDVFLHTDYYPWSSILFLDNRVVYHDDRTQVRVQSIEELPRCPVVCDGQIVEFPQQHDIAGRVFFLELDIESDVLGCFSRPVIYAFVENAAFCAERILPNTGRISHVIHVRFGAGLGGGGQSSGIWLLNVLRVLRCEVFITDSHYARQFGDERVYELYPSLAGNEDVTPLERIRVIRSNAWSGHADVSWNILREFEETIGRDRRKSEDARSPEIKDYQHPL
jgi:hypothetical protein